MQKYVYMFHEGNKNMRDILGGKGANLAEMTHLSLPTPQGFIVSTLACTSYYKNHEVLSENIKTEIFSSLHQLEKITNKRFGDTYNPLLVSVRSGAPVSMPGMMDSILNLGMNDEVAEAFSLKSNNRRFAYDSYRRLISMYADVVKGYDRSIFENFLDTFKKEKNIISDQDLTSEDMYSLVNHYKRLYKEVNQEEFPQDPQIQLMEAICAVFKSFNNDRAIYYRELNHIPSNIGTAVNVQEMVYGNMGENSGTGVAFSRNPVNGENEIFGEYLMNAQGEDVVAGIRTPKPIQELQKDMPLVYQEFVSIAKTLENHYKDMQDMEFTIENGRLYILQTRNGKRTSKASVKIAVDMVKEGKISKNEALLSVECERLNDLLHPTFKKEALESGKVIGKGLAASPGAASGHIYFTAEDAILAHERNEDVILVRKETSPEDIEGMHHANGILTIHGGMTSHAAVVARGMGVCCVSGCSDFIIDEENKTLTTQNGVVYHEKNSISLDGSTGIVYDGILEPESAKIGSELQEFLSWADEVSSLKVRANADTVSDAKTAISFGATGIGLIRTEHMFFDKERIFEFRKMILSASKEEREEALTHILPYQKEDFIHIYRVMRDLPVVIRLLDPPLHEFLPKTRSEMEELAFSLSITLDEMEKRILSLKEFNPMMGHRGCRLFVTYPEIARMQTKAIIEAAILLQKEGITVHPEIMIPLIGDENEFLFIKKIIEEEIENIMKEQGKSLSYEIGTMIEIPRATVIADKLASCATFFSFGTNDLTQFMYGFSRDDAGKFLKDYYDEKIFLGDPFKSIDEKGVGVLMKVAIDEAKKVNPNISLGVCGEHGGDEKSIYFCHRIGLSYVSCSPYRVPIARLAAAKAAIQYGHRN